MTQGRVLTQWFEEKGAYVLVDGQFGSTGKGLMAAYLAELGKDLITHVTTNAGPNSGHTAYFNGEKIMTQQIPVASVILSKLGKDVTTLINAGAMVDPYILDDEQHRYGVSPVLVHPCAALITRGDKINDAVTRELVAGTGKGVGPAYARKAMRQSLKGVARDLYMPLLQGNRTWDWFWDWDTDTVMVETAQGFSLGINSARFYPYTTCRECTVQQALADARIPISKVRKVIACFRTFPIRVGNTSGSSGECYADQEETSWKAIGQPAEITTVTKRERRVFTWSRTQFCECIATNRPDVIFLNFCNYLGKDALDQLVATIIQDYVAVTRRFPDGLLLGFGPNSSDVEEMNINE